MKKSLLFLLLLLLPAGAWQAVGQALPAPKPVPVPPTAAVATWEKRFFETPELTLPLLVAAAMQHSAEVGVLKTDQSLAHEDQRLARKALLSGVQLSGSYGYGNVSNTTVGDQSLTSALSKTASLHYSAGLNINVPVAVLLGWHNQLARQQLLNQRLGQLLAGQEIGVRQRIIDLYQQVLLARKLMAWAQQSYLTAEVNYQLGEKLFRSGEATLADMSQLNDRFIGAAAGQETAESSYATAFLQLENAVGTRVSELLSGP